MFQRVLVPLDGSDVAEMALEYAPKITDPQGRIVLLSVIDVPQYPASTFHPAGVVAYNTNKEVLVEELLPQTESYLKKVAESLQGRGFHAIVETTIGEAASAIVEKAEELKIEAIVMSTHGRSGISRWLFGSVAGKVISAAHCPVLIIPARKLAAGSK
jgi:nucleotide-binding universal stress UspA family protein